MFAGHIIKPVCLLFSSQRGTDSSLFSNIIFYYLIIHANKVNNHREKNLRWLIVITAFKKFTKLFIRSKIGYVSHKHFFFTLNGTVMFHSWALAHITRQVDNNIGSKWRTNGIGYLMPWSHLHDKARPVSDPCTTDSAKWSGTWLCRASIVAVTGSTTGSFS